MSKMKFFRMMAILAILAVLPLVGCKKHEHPAEHPEESGGQAAVTKDQLADAIEAYVKQESAGQGGYFMVMDNKSGQQLKLSLDKVHRKRLSKVGKNTYFACADFTTPDGKIYDLDVFMTGPNKDSLVFSDFSVHKEAGKERYTWYEEGGIWKKQTVGGGAEHPKEHPKKTEDEHPKKTEDEHPSKTEDEHPSEHPTEHPE